MTVAMNAAGTPVVRGSSGKGPRTKSAALRAKQRAAKTVRPRTTGTREDQR